MPDDVIVNCAPTLEDKILVLSLLRYMAEVLSKLTLAGLAAVVGTSACKVKVAKRRLVPDIPGEEIDPVSFTFPKPCAMLFSNQIVMNELAVSTFVTLILSIG